MGNILQNYETNINELTTIEKKPKKVNTIFLGKHSFGFSPIFDEKINLLSKNPIKKQISNTKYEKGDNEKNKKKYDNNGYLEIFKSIFPPPDQLSFRKSFENESDYIFLKNSKILQFTKNISKKFNLNDYIVSSFFSTDEFIKKSLVSIKIKKELQLNKTKNFKSLKNNRNKENYFLNNKKKISSYSCVYKKTNVLKFNTFIKENQLHYEEEKISSENNEKNNNEKRFSEAITKPCTITDILGLKIDQFSDESIKNNIMNEKSKTEQEEEFYDDLNKKIIINKINFNEPNPKDENKINSENYLSLDNNDLDLKYIKTDEDIRRIYLAKLIYKKIWEPTKKIKDHNSLIIFDWDDTILCTNFLTPDGIFDENVKITREEKDIISELDNQAYKILNFAIANGDTYIITNAEPGWVNYSANKFYPKVSSILNQIEIISARGEFERFYPGESKQWKIKSFLKLLHKYDTSLVMNFICLGDSMIEIEASKIFASNFCESYLKTIKFKENPSLNEMMKQLILINEQFPIIFSSVKNLTIKVEIKTKNKNKKE